MLRLKCNQISNWRHRATKEYPVVLVTGPRQVGKTTMLTKLMEGTDRGSMPAIVSGANSNSQIFYSSYLSTYMERDVRQLSDAIDSLKFLRFITAAAARCG